MGALVALLLEVEVVAEGVVVGLAAANGSKNDLHVELTPSLLVDGERWLLERCHVVVSSSSTF